MQNDNFNNVFLMPCGGAQANIHYNRTIKNLVDRSRIDPHVTAETRGSLEARFGDEDVAVWGAVDGTGNAAYFAKMLEGDTIIFLMGDQVKAVGEIALKTTSPALSKELWPNDKGKVFRLIYFIRNVEVVDSPRSKIFEVFGYKDNYVAQGLTAVSSDRLKKFYEDGGNVRELVGGD